MEYHAGGQGAGACGKHMAQIRRIRQRHCGSDDLISASLAGGKAVAAAVIWRE